MLEENEFETNTWNNNLKTIEGFIFDTLFKKSKNEI